MMIRLPLKCECPCCMSSYVKLNKDFLPFLILVKRVLLPPFVWILSFVFLHWVLISSSLSTGMALPPISYNSLIEQPTHLTQMQRTTGKENKVKIRLRCLYHCPHEFKRYVQYETHISVTCIAWWNALFLHNLMHFTLLQITFHCIVSKQIVGALWSCQSGELGGCNRPKWTQDHHHVTL